MFDGLLGAGADLLGGILTNQSQQQLANQANQFSAAQTDKQMQFQKEMRATQYQTTVSDLQKAGLNPMLAYSQGGAGTPTGSAAVGQQAQLQNPAKGFAHSASAAANIEADLTQKHANTTNTISQTGVNEEQRKLLDAQTAKVIAEIPNIDADTRNKLVQHLLIKGQTGLTSAQEAKTKQDIVIAAPEAAMAKTQYGRVRPYLKDAVQGMTSATSAYGKIK